MAVTTDILRTYRAPRQVVRDLLAMGPREDRAIAYVMVACLLVFVAQLPRLSRKALIEERTPTVMTSEQMEAHLQGWSAFDRLVTYEFVAWLMVWPLAFYGIALVVHGIRRIMGSTATGYETRLALFWAFLAAVPLGLLFGLTMGFIGPGPQASLVGVLWIAAFLIFAVAGLMAGGRDV
jgi:hypothetical protein